MSPTHNHLGNGAHSPIPCSFAEILQSLARDQSGCGIIRGGFQKLISNRAGWTFDGGVAELPPRDRFATLSKFVRAFDLAQLPARYGKDGPLRPSLVSSLNRSRASKSRSWRHSSSFPLAVDRALRKSPK